jgi:hypothetical protein
MVFLGLSWHILGQYFDYATIASFQILSNVSVTIILPFDTAESTYKTLRKATQKNLPLDSIHSQFKPVHILSLFYPYEPLNIILPSLRSFPSSLSLSGFPIKILCSFLVSRISITFLYRKSTIKFVGGI